MDTQEFDQAELQEELQDGKPTPEQTPEQKPDPTLSARFLDRLRRIFAPDVDPNDQVRIVLRLAMIVGIVYYLGMGFYGILTTGI